MHLILVFVPNYFFIHCCVFPRDARSIHKAFAVSVRLPLRKILLTGKNLWPLLITAISTLPANVEAERSILGAILLDNFAYNQAAEHLRIEDFSLDSHRRIYSRMVDLAESSRPIDMITLIEELDRHKDLQPIGDVAYVSSLVDGVPDRPSIEHYVKIVRDKALLRGVISAANTAIARASDQSDAAEDVLSDTEAAIFQLSEKRIGRGFMGVQEIVRETFGSVDALLQRGQRITGLATHYTDLDEMTSGLAAVGSGDHCGAAFDGQNRIRDEHRGECRD